jgi:hypothetical protein
MDFKSYNVNPETDSAKWSAFRYIRNKLLSESDWTQVLDNELSDSKREAWKQYRSDLRHLSDKYSDIDELELPERPV